MLARLILVALRARARSTPPALTRPSSHPSPATRYYQDFNERVDLDSPWHMTEYASGGPCPPLLLDVARKLRGALSARLERLPLPVEARDAFMEDLMLFLRSCWSPAVGHGENAESS